MKTLVAAATALLLMGVAPALAMTYCGGSKGKAAMCAKDGMKGGGMAMSRASKGKGCCCEGLSSGRMSRPG